MKTGRYGVESIAIWCPACYEFTDNPLDGSQQFTELDYDKIPRVLECGYCGEKFLKPDYPKQREQWLTRA